MKDLFNKKAIDNLNRKLSDLDNKFTDAINISRQPVEELVDSVRKDINEIAGIISAIMDYMGVKQETVIIDDPSYLPPIPKQKKVWKITKITKH